MSLLPPIPQQSDVTDEKGKLTPVWARFFQQLLSAFGGSVISYPITIANGGTGQTTQQGALDALSGSQVAGKFLRGDGTHVSMQTIQVSDVPILNQNTTGSAGSCVNFSGSLSGDVTGTQSATSVVKVNGGSIPHGATLVGTTSGGTFADASTAMLSNSTTGTATNVTGTVAIANGGSGQTTANAALNAFLPNQTGNSGKFLKTDGSNTSWATATAGANTAPTIQKFTSGSGTYTTPTSPAPLYIKVKMVGGGGGGSGSGTSGMTSGGTGGNTTFGTSLLVANGGAGGTAGGGQGGAGGTASLGTGPVGVALQGGQGQGNEYQGSLAFYSRGGQGAASPLGGEGGGSYSAVGGAAITNSGSGGGGAGTAGTSTGISGSGGGAGGFVEALISSPSATYSYAVGTSGNAGGAGTSGYAGGAGGSGLIIVEEHYQ